mgnify:FL=1
MKQLYFIITFIILIIIITVIGVILISPKKEVKEIKDTITLQSEIESEFSCYGYTIDNPKIIVNPYGNSPLTALIMFETDKREGVTITIKGKYDDDITYREANETKEHYIPIYGLYSNYENSVVLSTDTVDKEVKIKTNLVENNAISTDAVETTNGINLISTDNGVIGIDEYGETRYYLEGGYSKDIVIDKNNHLFLSTNRLNNDNSNTGIVNIDLLGKIYYEYNLEDGYNGLIYNVDDTKLLVLSENIILIDIQTGNVLKEYNLYKTIDNYVQLLYDSKTNQVILTGENVTLYYDYDKTNLDKIIGNKEYVPDELSTYFVDTQNINVNENIRIKSNNQIYDIENINLDNDVYFYLTDGIYLSKYKETETSNKNINILFSKEYQEEINIYKERDRLVIEYDFNKDDKVYFVLDKFLGKKVYEIDTSKNVKYINSYGLSGKYTIYLKINDKLLKLNEYVKF